tara:strand:+ start:735 stop:1859 length:1125 start_codon:yes stop_codon:yes gene_type:complete
MAIPPVAPGVQDQSVGGFEDVRRMPAPPQPMQPRPSLVVGGPAFFTPEGYQAPVQPEQAFMPTDRRTDAIGDNFRRPYERPIMPMPSPTPPPEMAQPAPPRVPIEQPIKEPVIDPGPITTQPVMPMPVPTPQPEYDPFAYSDLGQRALGGEYINSMTFHWFDPTTGKGGSTTEGWSRVPDSAKPYTYLNKEEANKAKENFMTFEDRGDIDTTPKRTPVTTPAPAPTVAAPQMPMPPTTTQPIDLPETIFDKKDVEGSLTADAVPTQADILDMYTPYLLGSNNPEYTLSKIKALEDAGYALEGAMPTSDIKIVPNTFTGGGSSFVPKVPQPPAPVVPQSMPSMPSLPSATLPTLPTLGSRPSLTRFPMRGNPRER